MAAGPSDLGTAGVILVVGFVVLSLSLHEYAHALVAKLRGDDTAERMGRLTPNPLVHLDPVMSVIVPLVTFYTAGMFFGGAKPVPVDTRRLKNPHFDMMLVALAGPGMNLILALVFAIAWNIAVNVAGYQQNMLLPMVLWYSLYMNIILAVFNMLPVPPLDGSRVVSFFLPPRLREHYAALERFGIFLVLILVFSGVFGVAVRLFVNPLYMFIASLAKSITSFF